MKKLPKAVIGVYEILQKWPEHDVYDIAQKLILPTPELVAMWQSYERRSDLCDDLWVWIILRQAKSSSNLPLYQKLNATDRQILSKRIENLAQEFSRVLEVNELDVQLVHVDGNNFNGFYFYEDFSDSNQGRIDDAGDHKLAVSWLVQSVAKRAQKIIEDQPVLAKGGKNAEAVRFIRTFFNLHESLYRAQLLANVAAATNALYATSYLESDIYNLLNR